MNILVLLIGANPLPNYVVAKYLLMDGRDDIKELPKPDKIIFVHSNDTESFALKIQKKSGIIKENALFCDLGKDERNPSAIRRKIHENLTKINNPISSIHLNYTGGTKPMAVHSYRVIENFAKDNCNLILSDLCPKNYKIIVVDKEEKYPANGDLRDKIKTSISDILDLHNMKIDNPGLEKTTFPDLNLNDFVKNVIDKMDTYKDVSKDIKNNSKQERFYKYYSKDSTQRAGLTSEIKKLFSNNNGSYYNSFIKKFPELKCVFNKYSIVNNREIDFYEFFTGKWLEDFILKTLQGLNITKVNDIKKGIKASYNRRETEIDVVVMKGYQMYLISCTTSHEIKIVKQKAFEALYRAEQLGGEHAQVIVVSLMNNKPLKNDAYNNLEELKKDLSQFDATKNCRLIGFDEIKGEFIEKKSLSNEFKKIIG